MYASARGGAIPVVDPTAADGVFSLLWLVVALPLAGAAILLVGGAVHRQAGATCSARCCRSARS